MFIYTPFMAKPNLEFPVPGSPFAPFIPVSQQGVIPQVIKQVVRGVIAK